jgi:peroxiredoxin
MRSKDRILVLLIPFMLATAIPAHAQAELKPGDVAPLVQLSDLAGTRHGLEDYRGKVTLVNFWGTWCTPCLDELPALERLYKRMSKKPFTILAVDVNQPQPDVARFARALGVTFPVLLDSTGKTAREWHVKIYPTTYQGNRAM